MKVTQGQFTDRKGVSLNQEAFTDLGFLFREQTVQDYGIDAHVELVENETALGQLLGVQIKSGPSFFRDKNAKGYIFRTDDEHIQYWLRHSLPVIVTVCDPASRVVYWQLISENTIESTGNGWKVVIPSTQAVNEQSLEKLKQAVTRLVPSQEYTVLSQGDVSWAGAKRYSLDILLNGTLTKAEIAQVIRQVILEHIGSRYYRDSIVESHWGESDAHAIFLFVYLTLDDRRDANWICRSLWLDESLPMESAPSGIHGENIGASIITEWSERYSKLSAIYRSHTLKKEVYVNAVKTLMGGLCPLVDRIISAIERERREESFSADGLLQELEPRVTQLYDEGSSLGLPPVECQAVDGKLQNVLTSAHNLVLPYCDFVTDRSRNTALEVLAIEDYRSELQYLKYELEKIR